ncbi:hypothetical protein AB0N88_05220 [Streptomyces sp. NPDC093516]|uniref:hypothetical protein n=1 Tax=Streptomyces sp. NPDC093516 TaxID=3155304 RepID=UPI00341A1442
MNEELTTDAAAAALRSARFGTLPDRIRYEDMTAVVETGPDSATKDAYDPAGSWKFYSCLALDLGL